MNDEQDVEYDSGPFCRHWGDPSDCAEVCGNCGHKCTVHSFESPGECNDCECKEWAEGTGHPADSPGLRPGQVPTGWIVQRSTGLRGFCGRTQAVDSVLRERKMTLAEELAATVWTQLGLTVIAREMASQPMADVSLAVMRFAYMGPIIEAIDTALERAALVTMGERLIPMTEPCDGAYNQALAHAANTIRALKSVKP